MSLITLTELKTYLGKTGTDDDSLLASVASNASTMAERDTGRVFAVASNVTHRYSTEAMLSLRIHDRPYSDGSRTVTLDGGALVEGQSVWFLPDRDNPEVATMVQLAPYDRSGTWYVSTFNWFDAGYDSPYAAGRTPNDLVITGVVGHPTLPSDVRQAVLELAAFLYWRAKGGASSYTDTLTGAEVDLTQLPQAYQIMIQNYRIRTAIMAV